MSGQDQLTARGPADGGCLRLGNVVVRWLVCLLILQGVAPWRAAYAAEPTPALTDYRITTWSSGDGITLGEVRGITQDHDGYLLLATERGLVRFDGFRFTTTGIVTGDAKLPVAPSWAVQVSRDGTIWAGFGQRHGIVEIAGGVIRGVHLQQDVSGLVNVISESRDGTLWVGHATGLHRRVRGRWEQVPLETLGAAPLRVVDVREDTSGVIWLATSRGVFRGDGRGAFVLGSGEIQSARGLSEDLAGGIWTTDETRGYRRADRPAPSPQIEARGMNLFHDSRGNLWVTTIGQGVWLVRPNAYADDARVSRLTVQHGLASDESSEIFEDRDGNIWIGSLQGLNRLTPYDVITIRDVGVVRSLAFDAAGRALAATATGLLALADPPPTGRGRLTSLNGRDVHVLHTARDGMVWAATAGGVHRLVGDRLVSVPFGRGLTKVTAMASQQDGTLWIIDGDRGLVRQRAGQLQAVSLEGRPLFPYVSPSDEVWVALEGGRVASLVEDRVAGVYGAADGLPHRTVSSLYVDHEGALWVGGELGLSRRVGTTFKTLLSGSRLPQLPARPGVSGFMQDSQGSLWVAVPFVGIVRLPWDEVTRALEDASYQLRYQLFDSSSGVAFTDTFHVGSTLVRGPEETIWAIASRGVTVIDTANLGHTPLVQPRRPRIEGIAADERYFAAADPVLPAHTDRLRIDYTIINLSFLERTQFRYRLDGFDTAWVDGTPNRQALYTNLPPGRYRFRLQSSGSETAWHESEVDWRFSIEPAFYQTGRFYGLCVLAIAAAVASAWTLRIRHVRREVALVFGERIRVAREIHDTLLQSVVGISMQVDSARRDIHDQPARAHDRLLAMKRHLDASMREARRAIWNLRSPALGADSLISTLRTTGHQLTAGDTAFSLTVTGAPRDCPASVESQALRIGQEAIVNALKHADARHVAVKLEFESNLLRLSVKDDGQGFPASRDRRFEAPDHYGLLSMTERAAEVGGRCRIDSEPGVGAVVVAEFPLPPAA